MRILVPILLVAAHALTASVRFEANRGQTRSDVAFIARTATSHVFFTGSELVFDSGVRMTFVGGRGAWSTGAAAGAISYVLGNDPGKWVREAPVFDRLTLRSLYRGVDAVFYGNAGRLEYDLVLAPGADPTQIRLKFTAKSRLLADGSIRAGAIEQRSPVIYQVNAAGEREKVGGRFRRAAGGEYKLLLDSYDRTRPLIVDPTIEFSGILGGENDDEITVVGENYVAGNTRSVAFPGAIPQRRRSKDVFFRTTAPIGFIGSIPAGVTVVIGGSGDDELAAVLPSGASSGPFLLGGTTSSRDFPVATGMPGFAGGATDGFLFDLTFSTGAIPANIAGQYVGGSGDDRIHALDWSFGSGFAYAGETTSSDLRVTDGSRFSGGTDAFYGLLFTSTAQRRLGYLGGSGNDAAYAVASIGNDRALVAGETHSSDFVQDLQGESDAFLSVVTLYDKPATFRFGGSGRDRITAMTSRSSGPSFTADGTSPQLPAGIVVGGDTTSPDLATRNAAQPALAGRQDGFAGIWDADLRDFIRLTYLGTAREDHVSSLARTRAGDIAVGGWTRNENDEGFVVFLDADGALREWVAYGGSGDDRILSLAHVAGAVRAGGVTTSRDLGILTPPSGPADTGTDGFTVDIGVNYLMAPAELVLAKDSLVQVAFRPRSKEVRLPIAYSSSDPAKVRVLQSTGAAEDNVWVEALSDSGEVDLIAQAPGYESKVVKVKLYPGVYTIDEPLARQLFVSSFWVLARASYRAFDRERNRILTPPLRLRAGVQAPTVSWNSSDPDVLEVSSISFQEASLLPLGRGVSRLSISAPGFETFEPDPVLISVEGRRASAGEFRLGRDLQMVLPIIMRDFGFSSAYPVSVTAVSEDPSRLVLSADATAPGQERITVLLGEPIYAQALSDEGTVRVLLESPAVEGQWVYTFTLEPAVLHWGAFTPGLTAIKPDLTVMTFPTPLAIGLSSLTAATLQSLRPGAPPVIVRVANDAPEKIELNRLVTRGDGREGITLTGRDAGTARLTASVTPHSLRIASPSVRAEYRPRPVEPAGFNQRPPSALNVGRGLQAQVQFAYDGAGTVTITSSDPNVVLAAGADSVSVSELRMTAAPRLPASFYVRALRNQGQASITVRLDSGEMHEMRVTSLPSGIAIMPAAASGGLQRATITTVAVDESTGFRLDAQPLQPGERADVHIDVEGVAVGLSATRVLLENANPSAVLTYELPPPGSPYTLRVSAAGFETVRDRGSVQVAPELVPVPLVSIAALSAVKNGVTRAFIIPAQVLGQVTFTSEDPSLLLVSLSDESPGQPSVTSNDPQAPLWLHGKAAAGSTALVITDSRGSASRLPVHLGPMRVIGSSVSPLTPGGRGETRFGLNAVRQPGLAPLRLSLRTQNPAVAKLDVDVLELDGRGFVSVPLHGVAIGATSFVLDSTEDVDMFVAPNSIIVSPTASTAPLIALGKDFQTEAPSAGTGTLTSSDPAKVLVSRSPGEIGSRSIEVSTGQPFFVQALDSSGDVPLRLTSGGVQVIAALIRLQPSWMALEAGSSTMTPNSWEEIRVSLKTFQTTSRTLTPRPGLPPLSLRLLSSNPSAVQVRPETVELGSQRQATVIVTAVGLGDAVLRVEQPDPRFLGRGSAIRREVSRPLLYVGCTVEPYLKLNERRRCVAQNAAGATITAQSSDPAKLTVIPITAATFEVQALASSGTFEVTFRAPGFADQSLWFALRP